MSELIKFKFHYNSTFVSKEVSIETEEEMPLDVFILLRDFVYSISGIYFQESKKYLLENRIKKRLKILKIAKYKDYYNHLKSSNAKEEINELYIAVTINETYFFRAEAQFECFEKVLIPNIVDIKKGEFKPQVKIWSAASSSGEEAYTLAIILLEKLIPKYPRVDFQIIATDININVIEQAKKGEYRDYAIRNIPHNLLKKYFSYDGSTYKINNEVKNLVKFSQLNLYDTFGMRQVKNIDILFCCNVLIYFDMEAKKKVLSSLSNSLTKDGYLFIGYSETLSGITNEFQLLHFEKALVYQKVK